MDWLGYFISLIVGIILTLLVQFFLIVYYIWRTPTGCPIPSEPPPTFQLPKNLDHLGMYSDNGDCAAALSLTMQFLFQELKYAHAPVSWLHKKLHQEMIDLLTRTTSGKFFESLTIRSILMGNAAPCIRWAGVQNVETQTEGRIKTLDLLLDIYYSGGFRLCVDAGMLLGKTANIDIEVEQLSGRARIRFTREPYTHWSISFLSPPHLELCAKPLTKHLASLFQAHARRVLQKNHTLPNYTIRYKPFFSKNDPAQLDFPMEDVSLKVEGEFQITLSEITRLFTDLWAPIKDNCEVYCTLSLDSNPWISYHEDLENCIYTLDLVVNKENCQQLGTVFKQITQNINNKVKTFVVIETVSPLSAAYKADLRRNDVILAVDNKLITNMNQIPKIVKNVRSSYFTIRVERRSKKNLDSSDLDIKSSNTDFRKNSSINDDYKSNEYSTHLKTTYSNLNIQEINNKTETDSKILIKKDSSLSPIKTSNSTTSLSKHIDAIQSPFGFGLRKRRCSVENKTSSDSSNSSTPTTSIPGTPSKRDHLKREKIRSSTEDKNSILNTDNSLNQNEIKSNDEPIIKTQYDYDLTMTDQTIYKQMENNSLLQSYSSNSLSLSDVIIFDQSLSFKLNRNHRYININVWGKSPKVNDDTLLAYLNIPLLKILKECNKSKINKHEKKFVLLPPEVNLSVSKIHPLSSHSGFEPCLCYGDILLSFLWIKKNNEKITKKLSIESKESQESVPYFLEEYDKNNTNIKTPDDVSWKPHNFIRTHFHRSTQCDFCSKKIWLKDAVQCQDCSMCCHKKCVTKCLSTGRCQPSQDGFNSPQNENQIGRSIPTPGFLMTEHSEDSNYQNNLNSPSTQDMKDSYPIKSDENLLGRSTLTGLLGGLRRVGSAQCLSPTSHGITLARSLPPSPQHSPRSQSPDDDAVWLALETMIEEGIFDPMDLIKPMLSAQLLSDVLLSKAKDYGPRLLAHMSPDKRIEKITALITEVRNTLDKENKKSSSLQSEIANKSTLAQNRFKQLKLLDESEEITQALIALLLHCSSAMQNINQNSI